MTYPFSYCWAPGYVAGIIMPSGLNTRARLRIEVDRGTAVPGNYNLQFVFSWLFQEIKANSLAEADATYSIQRNISQFLNGTASQSLIPVEVRARCELSGKASSGIFIDHGSFAPKKNAASNNEPLYLRCDPGSSATLKLRGNESVPGRETNFTRCGNDGSCELTFKYEGGYEHIFGNSTSSTSNPISIQSTYHPNIGTPKPGSFTGSGILEMIVN